MKKAAQVINAHSSDILKTWSEQVNLEVKASKETERIALYDHLPNLLEDITDIMMKYNSIDDLSENTKYKGIIQNSVEHGRHRATSLYYTVDQIVHEYLIFHKVITNMLMDNKVFNIEVGNLLKYLIETSMLESVGSFSISIEEMQEKLIGTLAHDIRNPLSAAQLALNLIDFEDGKASVVELKDAAVRSVNKSLSLIEGLMDSITVKAGEGMMFNFTEMDLMEDILWVYKEAKEIYTREIKIVHKDESIHGVFDGTAIRRLLENLLSNAIKYGEIKSVITLTVENNENDVKISVHNYGNPIDDDKLKFIFSFLGRNNLGESASLKSWGIGLTLVKLVADAHGGYIEVISNEREGTTFRVNLKKDFNKPGKKRVKLLVDTKDKVNQ